MLELRLAWRNIWRHRRRTWLTIGAMVFCNMLLVFSISLQFGFYQMMIDNTLQVLTGHNQLQAPGFNDEPGVRKTLDNIEILAQEVRENFPNAHAAARGMGFALVSSEERSYGVQVLGVQPEYEPGVSVLPGLIKEGSYLSNDSAQEVIIGSVLARNLKISLGDEVTLLGSGWDGSFAADVLNVVGIYEVGMPVIDRSIAMMPIKRFQDSFSMDDRGHVVVVKDNEIANSALTNQQLKNQFSDNPEIAVLDWDQLQPGLQQAIKADMTSAWFMYGLLVILVAFSVMNTQLMSVLERTREFGVVMALGLRSRRLMRLIFFETAFMSFVGMVLGMLVGAILVAWLEKNGFTYPGLDEMADKFNMEDRVYPQLSLRSLLTGPVVVFLGSMIAAIYPALRLRKLTPISAMRAV